MDFNEIIALYVDCIKIALPFTITFYICNLLVSTFLRTAFGGKLTFRSF